MSRYRERVPKSAAKGEEQLRKGRRFLTKGKNERGADCDDYVDKYVDKWATYTQLPHFGAFRQKPTIFF